ncbi:MAG: hypothetical protein IPM29_24270 [Planctomycetes bacterium]|nr:hypothetical protein [Planctomycetota bacterium]
MLPKIYAATQAGELFEVDPNTGAYSWMADMHGVAEFASGPVFGGLAAAPVRDLVVFGSQVTSVQQHADRARLTDPINPPSWEWWLRTRPWQNFVVQPESPRWYQDPVQLGLPDPDEAPYPPKLPIYYGLSPLMSSGSAAGFGTIAPPPGGGDPDVIRYVHWWGGQADTYPNLVQGAWIDPQTVLDSWYSSRETIGPNHLSGYGSSATLCKDLRNNASQDLGSMFSLQSLRIGEDSGGTVLVLNTAGGSVTLLRPPPMSVTGSTPGTHMGEVIWNGSAPDGDPGLDDGFGGMALATRQVPSDPLQIDIFAGTCLTYPDPNHLPTDSPSALVTGAIRWLRWDGTSMQTMGDRRVLEPPTLGGRGGFAVSGLAVGDVIHDEFPGDELVATTMAGDLFVFALGTSGIGPMLVHTWVPGSLGAYNAILIEDFDLDGENELYVGGSQGIWKWRQK